MLVQQRCGRITVLLPFFFSFGNPQSLTLLHAPCLVGIGTLWISTHTVAHEALNAGTTQSFFPALTSMPKSDDGRAALQMLQLGGFIAPEARSFDRSPHGHGSWQIGAELECGFGVHIEHYAIGDQRPFLSSDLHIRLESHKSITKFL